MVLKRFTLVLVLLMLAGCDITVLNPKSTTGKDQAFLIWFSFGLMLIVLLVVFFLFIKFVATYRYTDKRANFIPEDVHGNKWLELTWTVLPILLLIVLAVPTVAITYNQSPISEALKKDDAVQIEVEAQQYQWTFTHEGGKAFNQELVIPEGKTIRLHLKSKDVIHSFWVPALGGKVDVMPHKDLYYEIKNPEVGTYHGKCAEYCGLEHAKMIFTAKVVTEDAYEQYLKEEG